MIQLRAEQILTIEKAIPILQRYNIVLLAAQSRTGKSLMSLTIARDMGWKRVGFITRKIAIKSVELDFQQSEYSMELVVKNYERILELPKNMDGYIVDEIHSLGAFPKPSKRAKDAKEVIGKRPVIMLSATPTPESYSQIFHEFYISYYSPFVYSNFYKWAKDYVDKKQKFINGFVINDWAHAKKDKVMDVVNNYIVTLSQEEAGFTTVVDEEILFVKAHPQTYALLKLLKDKKVVDLGNGDQLVADTPVKMQSLYHQICSGTVIAENKSYILDMSKANFIKERFSGQKIALFHKFIQEKELLQQTFPNNTNDPEEFNATNKTFIGQFLASREGVNLSTADCIVALNIDFSATTYHQFRQRTQHKERKTNSKLYWIFIENGIEEKIYKIVQNKKSYTSNYFLKDFQIKRW